MPIGCARTFWSHARRLREASNKQSCAKNTRSLAARRRSRDGVISFLARDGRAEIYD
jgi:hypothetical protein